jgi:hypothetical protein
MTDIADVVIRVGQEVQVKVYNATASQIDNGNAVYITGISGGGIPTIDVAKADTIATSLAIGLAVEDIPASSEGRVTKDGIVRGINTSGLNVGLCYLSSTVAGGKTSTEPSPPNVSFQLGQVLVADASDGIVLVDLARVLSVPQTVTFTLPLRGVVSADLYLTGDFRTVASGQTGDYVTDFAVANNHGFILVNTITGTGNVTFTGTSVSESTGLAVVSDTEVIAVDATASQYYQTAKKWWEITNIDIPTGISAINYDVGVVGYTDINNQNFELLAYRLDAVSQGVNSRLRFKIIKIQDDGDNKMSVVDIEDIEVNAAEAGDVIIDWLRTGGDDRSYNPGVANLWANATTIVFKQSDFGTYFTLGENIFDSGIANEGLILRFEDSNNVDFAVLQVRYRSQ